jgi:hypothetical protein
MLTYSSLTAILAHLKNCPFGVNTAIELKNITTSDNTGTLLRGNITPLDAITVVCSCNNELNRSFNSKWQLFDCATVAFSERLCASSLIY